MTVTVSSIVPGTAFMYAGKEFKLTTEEWGRPHAHNLRPGWSVHESLKKIGKGYYEAAKGCAPKLGGMFQDRLTVWIPADATVEVE